VAYNSINGKMYVTDEGAGQLLIVNPTLRTVEKALGGLANPRGVAIESGTGTAYVASSGAAELRRYTLSDVNNNTQGSGLNIGNYPTGVVVDKKGRIWVTTQNELVRVIWTGTGTETKKWGVPGSFGIAYDAGAERLYVTTGGSSSLIGYDISGTGDPVQISGSPFKTSPEYNLDWLALNSNTGRIYVAGRTTASADHPRASKLWVFSTATSTFGALPFDLDSWNDNTMMRGVSLDKQGRVYVSSEYTDRVYVFSDCGGGPTPTPGPTPGCAPKSGGSVQLAAGSLPYGSAANDASGQAFVANHGSASIIVLNGTSVVGTVSPGPSTIGGVWGVAYNGLNDRIYVTDETHGQLLIVNPTLRTVEKALGGLASPRGVVIESGTGTAYVASSGAAELRRYTLSDVKNNTQGSGLNVGNYPTGVALDKRGRIWVTTQNELVRVIWTGTGTDTKKWGVPGSFGVAYNAGADRLYVTTGWNSELLTYDVSAAGDPVLLAPAFKTSPVEYNLDWLGFNPSTGRLFAGGRRPSDSSRLFVFDTITNAWSATSFALDSSWDELGMVRGVSFEPKLKRIYVSSEFSDKVYVFNDTGACP
jgi:DNA-binding beta-propeller fold protein YncE